MNATNFSLIPVSQSAQEKVSEVFASTMFGNVNTFIAMFNSGFLNRSYEENKDYSELIEKSFGNVYKSKSVLVVQSPEEYQASVLSSVFDDWKTIARLRREVDEATASGTVDSETVLYVAHNGLVYTVDADKKQMFTTKFSRVNKESAARILGFSSIRQGDFLEDDNEYNENNGYNADSEYNEDNENNEFSLDSSDFSQDVESEEEDDDAVDAEGKELPENAESRTVKVSDLTAIDDSFISAAYDIISESF